MKVKRFRGNVTILALFILLACSLCGVLVALYMKNFIKYSDEISSYEKTNYLAKAGTELGLAIVGSRDVGVVYSIDSGNIIMGNFECPFPEKEDGSCSQEPKFSLEINGLANSYKNCETNGEVEIKPGLSAIIPLFKDGGINNLSEALQPGDIENRITVSHPLSSNGPWNWKFGVVWNEDDSLKIQQWEGLSNRVGEVSSHTPSNMDRAYFIIANAGTSNSQTLCVKGDDIPQDTVKIVSVGYYNGRQLGTETLATKALPDFLQGDNYLVNN